MRKLIQKGRGSGGNESGRFESWQRHAVDDGWEQGECEAAKIATTVTVEHCKKIITVNRSADVPFDYSINPYQGCEHGCSYCFARPTHAYYGLSAGLDFETRLFAKKDAAQKLKSELAVPGYRPSAIAIGANTDPYQPVEKRLAITRDVLQVLLQCRHPAIIVTKSAGIIRDVPLLAEMAKWRLIHINISVTTLDKDLSRAMEPRAAGPSKRLQVIGELARAGVPVSVLVAPLIPALNDHEMETILKAVRSAGALGAGYVLLRLPHEVKSLFSQWLRQYYPDKERHVLSLIRQLHGGRLYDHGYGRRMRGQGSLAELLNKRFELYCKKSGLNREPARLSFDNFQPPAAWRNPRQGCLF